MQKITDLRAFIIGLDLVAAEQIESFVDDLVVTPALRNTAAADEIVAAELHYFAMFYIERYPYAKKPAAELLAQISAWLIQNDTGRTDPVEFPVNVEINDYETADLEFGILFRENIRIKAEASGSIVVDGVNYKLI